MPLNFPAKPYERKHAPQGYKGHKSFKPWLRDEFQFRCVYCLERERWYPSGHHAFSVEHVKPKADPDYEHLELEYTNLVYACLRCNSAKQMSILIDPCVETLADHLRFEPDGSVVGTTTEGEDMIGILGLDQSNPTRTRREHIQLYNLYKDYPHDVKVRELFLSRFGYPDDMPTLSGRRGRNGNKGSDKLSYMAKSKDGTLEETY